MICFVVTSASKSHLATEWFESKGSLHGVFINALINFLADSLKDPQCILNKPENQGNLVKAGKPGLAE